MTAYSAMIGRYCNFIKAYCWMWLSVGLLICLAYANYAALKTSYLLLNYDTTPSGEDSLLGMIFETFGLYELTLADIYAIFVAIAIGVGTLFWVHFFYKSYRIGIEMHYFNGDRNSELYQQLHKAFVLSVSIFVFLSIPYICVVINDMNMLRFRVACWVLNLDGDTVASTMKNWDIISKEHSELFSIRLIPISTWAYLGVVMLISLIVEKLYDNKEEEWAVFKEAALNWYNESFKQAAKADAAFAMAEPVEGQMAAGAQEAFVPPLTNVAEDFGASEQPETMGEPKTHTRAGERVVPFPERPTQRPSFTDTANTKEEELVTVLGGDVGEKVRFSEAVANPENYVIDSSRRVWKKSFWDAFNLDPDSAQAA